MEKTHKTNTARQRELYWKRMADPEYRKKYLADQRKYQSTAAYKAKYKARMRERFADSAYRELRNRQSRERRAADPEYRKRCQIASMNWYLRHRVIWRIEMDKLLAAFRSGGCSSCTEKDPVCLDAHHSDPSKKKYAIAKLYMGDGGGHCVERMREELKNCTCLCANCHRKLHSKASVP